MKQSIVVIIFCIFLGACNHWALDTRWKSGKFRLVAIDAEYDMSLVFEDNHAVLVGPTVFAVGANEKYIILKQYPALDPVLNPNGPPFDRSTINYFIVDYNKNIQGPLTKEEYDKLALLLSLPSFTTTFKNLE